MLASATTLLPVSALSPAVIAVDVVSSDGVVFGGAAKKEAEAATSTGADMLSLAVVIVAVLLMSSYDAVFVVPLTDKTGVAAASSVDDEISSSLETKLDAGSTVLLSRAVTAFAILSSSPVAVVPKVPKLVGTSP